jgi:hypothetical protein
VPQNIRKTAGTNVTQLQAKISIPQYTISMINTTLPVRKIPRRSLPFQAPNLLCAGNSPSDREVIAGKTGQG